MPSGFLMDNICMIKWNKITWYSRLLAAIFFIGVLPAWTYYLGIQYGEVKVLSRQSVVLKIPAAVIPSPLATSTPTTEKVIKEAR